MHLEIGLTGSQKIHDDGDPKISCPFRNAFGLPGAVDTAAALCRRKRAASSKQGSIQPIQELDHPDERICSRFGRFYAALSLFLVFICDRIVRQCVKKEEFTHLFRIHHIPPYRAAFSVRLATY